MTAVKADGVQIYVVERQRTVWLPIAGVGCAREDFASSWEVTMPLTIASLWGGLA